MAKYRIVQVKPESLPAAFEIQEQIVILQDINPKYKANQSYWEGTFKYNAGARPKDWFIKTNKPIWKLIGSASTFEKAEKILTATKLGIEMFVPKVIKEYD